MKCGSSELRVLINHKFLNCFVHEDLDASRQCPASLADGRQLMPLLGVEIDGGGGGILPRCGSHVVCRVGCAYACVRVCRHVQVCTDARRSDR